MAPNCPEELDVFSIPHSRMKELVQKYLNMVSEINFADTSHLTNLLENLVNTFREFKAHEQIENKYIMKKLKEKLKALSIRNTALCNCHSDNRLTDMLELVQDGYKCTQKTELDRKNFGLKLRKALEDFTEQFIPHMEEEEEVFQPMLIKYFTSDELRRIKYKVLKKHFCQSDVDEKEKLYVKPDLSLSDSSDEESEKLKPSRDSLVTKVVDVKSTGIDILPSELVMKIFSYVSPKDLGMCAQVCHRWNTISMDGSLWRNFLPVQWAKGIWSFSLHVDFEEEECNLITNKEECGMVFYDEDADIDESEDSIDSPTVQQMKRETSMLACMMRYLLPKVGHGVRTVNLAYSQGLVNSLLYKILSLCPHIENLDLTHTRISDGGFKSLGKNGCGSDLKFMDLTGCQNITDTTLLRLSNALHSKCEPDCLDYSLCEKNETEASEKGDNSMTSNCFKENVLLKIPSLSMSDTNDHHLKWAGPRTNEISINQKNKTNNEPETRINKVLKHEESQKLTFNNENYSAVDPGFNPAIPGTASLNCCRQQRTSRCCHNMTDKEETYLPENVAGNSELALDCESAVEFGLDYSSVICGLQHLSLSGCSHITDKGLRALVEGNHTFPELQFLDLSGCDKVTSGGLKVLVSACESLDHQYLYYCDNLTHDPYFDSASGCQNLECPTRACCRSGS